MNKIFYFFALCLIFLSTISRAQNVVKLEATAYRFQVHTFLDFFEQSNPQIMVDMMPSVLSSISLRPSNGELWIDYKFKTDFQNDGYLQIVNITSERGDTFRLQPQLLYEEKLPANSNSYRIVFANNTTNDNFKLHGDSLLFQLQLISNKYNYTRNGKPKPFIFYGCEEGDQYPKATYLEQTSWPLFETVVGVTGLILTSWGYERIAESNSRYNTYLKEREKDDADPIWAEANTLKENGVVKRTVGITYIVLGLGSFIYHKIRHNNRKKRHKQFCNKWRDDRYHRSQNSLIAPAKAEIGLKWRWVF